MFKEIFLFEIRYRLNRPAVYLCILIPFLFALYAFSSGSVAAGQNQFYNAPAVLARFSALISFFTLLLTSAIMGPSMYRDIEYEATAYYLSYPINKGGYFFGRFAGSFFFVLLMGIVVMLGTFLGTLLGPAMDQAAASHYGSQQLAAYLLPYLILLLPNMLLCSCLFFGLVAITRNARVIYSSGVLLLLAYMAARVYFDFTNNDTVSQLADPFAYNSVRLLTAVYSPAELNTAYLSVSGLFLANRLIWLGIAIGLLLLTYLKFSLDSFFSGKARKGAIITVQPLTNSADLILPVVSVSFQGGYSLQAFATQLRVEVKSLSRDRFFWLIILACTLFEGFSFWLGTQNYQVRDLPRTVAMLNTFKNDFLPYLFVILVFYTGEVLHRERATRFALINDALPPRTGLFHLAKVFSLLMMGAFIMFIPNVVAMLVQISKGYTDFHLGLYLQNYVLLLLPAMTEMVILAYLVHVLIGHKFAGHIAGILLWFGFTQLLPGYTDFKYRLFLYGTAPFFNYSDMEGVGHMLTAVSSFHVYWLQLGTLLLLAAYLYYPRETTIRFRERIRIAGQRITLRITRTIILFFFLFLVAGSWIYYNVSVLNPYQTEDNEKLRQVQYEQQFKRYEKLPQPEISALKLKVDIYPTGQRAAVRGLITLVNTSSAVMDSVFMDGEALNSYTFTYQGKTLNYASPLLYFRPSYCFFGPSADTSLCRVYALPRLLAQGDSITLNFRSSISHRGFQNDLYGTDITPNGTYFNGGLPVIGYSRGKELAANEDRAKYHLPLKKSLADGEADAGRALTQPRHTQNNDMTITIDAAQTAIASGVLIAQRNENGRGTWHYIQNNSPGGLPPVILSAKYAKSQDVVLTGTTGTALLTIAYHPGHETNLGRFSSAIQDAVHQESVSYGSYPFRQLRLAETSNYGPYIGVYPGVVTYAEYYGWQADFRRQSLFDYCYFVTARAVAQQWWKFGLRVAEAPGSGVITDGLASYDALRLQEKQYGKEALLPLLQYELQHYLMPSRTQKRVTLLHSDRNYNTDAKAGLVLYGLEGLIGEDRMNRALRTFRDTFSSTKNAHSAGSADLYRFLKRYTPDSLQYYLNDIWEKNTVYDNQLLSCKAVPINKTNQYRVTLICNIRKFYADQNGREQAAMVVNDLIEVCIFGDERRGKDGRLVRRPLLLKKVKFAAGKNEINFTVTGKPVSGAIDPYFKLIDGNIEDQSRPVVVFR